MRVATAISDHPLPPHAVGECLGRLLEVGGAGADGLVLLLGPSLRGAAEDVALAARSILRPGVDVCATVAAALTGSSGPSGSAIVAMGLWGDDGEGCWIRAVDREPVSVGTTVVFGVPGAQPVQRSAPGLVLGPGWNARWATVVGADPVGPTWSVTGAEGARVWSLGAEPAIDVLARVLGALPDRRLVGVAGSLHLEELGEVRRVHRLRAVDRDGGALVLDGDLRLGSSVRFVLGDDEALLGGLRRTLSGVSALAAWVFAARSRLSIPLAAAVEEVLAEGPVAASPPAVVLSPAEGGHGRPDASGVDAAPDGVQVLLVG